MSARKPARPLPKDHVRTATVADVAVGGDIHRIILDGITPPPADSALEARAKVIAEFDALRQVMLSYPYGNEDMCADLLFPSKRAEAASAYIIMECMGYPYYSGSNTMAAMAALVEYGRVPASEGLSTIRLEAPSGLVEGQMRLADGVIEEVTVRGDEAYVVYDERIIDVPGIGPVTHALVWSGAPFIMLQADAFGIAIDEAHLPAMKDIGKAVIEAVRPDFALTHPDIGPIDSIGFVHFMGPMDSVTDAADGIGYRAGGATYGHPATVFHCPTGTGTAARMALEVERGMMAADGVFEITSPPGHPFIGRGQGLVTRSGQQMLATTVSAKPFVLGTTVMEFDFDNPVMRPFEGLRALLKP